MAKTPYAERASVRRDQIGPRSFFLVELLFLVDTWNGGAKGSRCERADVAAASLAPADARDRRGAGSGVGSVAGRLSDQSTCVYVLRFTGCLSDEPCLLSRRARCAGVAYGVALER